ncbi:MAG: SDR family NAD(P)-dependent oxidoreductase [Chloroflexi bacterium]|nr:SDR family NAD(P)-dependent oxidoreductase [Chloroflexota bacterium]
MMGKLEGKVAVVTGAGRGIGRAVALLLAQEDAKVVVNDPGVGPDGVGHDEGPAEQVVAEIKEKGGTAVPNYDSVATMEGGESIVRTALDNFGRLDVLVNNAGILRDRMIFNMTEEEWDAVIAVHLKGHFACTRPASAIMREQRYGRIINFSSESGLWGNAGQANYGSAKAAIAGFTRVVARDLGRYGITCNAIAPRAWTRLTATIPQERPQAGGGGGGAARAAPAPDVDRLAQLQPEYVAPMVCYLATDDAWIINGQIFLVYGGTVALLQHPLPWRTAFKPGLWTFEELSEIVPHLLEGTRNPAPPPEELEIPGREKPEPQPAA